MLPILSRFFNAKSQKNKDAKLFSFFYIFFASLLLCAFTSNIIMNPQYNILIDKSERKLFLYKDKTLVKKYDIALGFNPAGTKHKSGDGATPEGKYFITHKNEKSKFYLSLGISYPNKSDAEGGLNTKLITQQVYDQIISAIDKKQKPPQNTDLGGDIFIHGGGAGKLFGKNKDWTWGCIAMENDDINDLFNTIPVRTPVKIIP